MPLTVKNVTKKVGFRLIKILDIVYLSLLYVLLAGSVCWGINAALPEKFIFEHPVARLTELVGITLLLPVVAYIARNLIIYAPSPYNGVFGLNSYRVKERMGSVILAFTLVLFMPKLLERAKVVQQDINSLTFKKGRIIVRTKADAKKAHLLDNNDEEDENEDEDEKNKDDQHEEKQDEQQQERQGDANQRHTEPQPANIVRI